MTTKPFQKITAMLLAFILALGVFAASPMTANAAGSVAVGDKLYFGNYGGEPILWRVTAVSGADATLMSEYTLWDTQYHNSTSGSLTFETYDIYAALQAFKDNTSNFTTGEQAAISGTVSIPENFVDTTTDPAGAAKGYWNTILSGSSPNWRAFAVTAGGRSTYPVTNTYGVRPIITVAVSALSSAEITAVTPSATSFDKASDTDDLTVTVSGSGANIGNYVRVTINGFQTNIQQELDLTSGDISGSLFTKTVTISAATLLGMGDSIYSLTAELIHKSGSVDTKLAGMDGGSFTVFTAGQDMSSVNGTPTTTTTVFMGEYSSSPIEWYLIDKDMASWTLLSKNNLGTTQFHESDNAYTTSILKKAVDIRLSGFSSEEQSAMADVDLDEIAGVAVTGQKLWPLSETQAKAVNTSLRSIGSYWWLRSPGGSIYGAKFVRGDGSFGVHFVYSDYGIRPAFNLTLSSVLFTSDSVFDAPTAADSALNLFTASAVAQNLKLTLDSKSTSLDGFSLTSPGDITKTTGDNLELTYSAGTNNNNFVRVKLSQNGAIKYTGIMASGLDDSGGTASIPLTGVATGSYDVSAWVEQGNAAKYTNYGTTPVEFTLTVGAANTPAIGGQATATDAINLTEGYTTEYTKSYNITGNPAPTVAMSAANTAGASIENGTLTIPLGLSAGSSPYTANFTATNSAGTATMAVTVNVLTTTTPPALTMATPSDATATEGEAFSKTFSVTYTGTALPLGYSSNALPAGLTLNTGTGEISGTPDGGSAGSYPITVGVTDGSLSANGSFILTVDTAPVPAALAMGALDDDTVTVGSPYNKTVSVNYTGTDTLEYSASGQPASLSIDQTTGIISGVLTANDIGDHTITVDVADNNGLSDNGSFTLTVEDLPPPLPNTHIITASAGTGGSITPSGSVVVNEGDNQSFSITADSGYSISDVLVDGSSIGAATDHTFDNVTASHSIEARFASSYTPPYNPPSRSDNDSGNSKADTPVVIQPQPVTMHQAQDAYNAALKIAKEQGTDTVKPILNGYSELPLDILQSMAKWAARDGMSIKIYAGQIKDFAITSRLVIDPAKSTMSIQLIPSTESPDAVNTANKFKKWFSNKLFAVSTGQTGGYGQPVEIILKPDLTGMDTENLYFYSYDKATNTYKRIENPAYWIDKNGYLHFITPYAGDIIISENPLKKR